VTGSRSRVRGRQQLCSPDCVTVVDCARTDRVQQLLLVCVKTNTGTQYGQSVIQTAVCSAHYDSLTSSTITYLVSVQLLALCNCLHYATACTLQLFALCNCLHFATVCTVQLLALCNCLHFATVCTVQLLALCNCLHCATACTLQLFALCYCLHCATACTVQLFALCNCLHCVKRKVSFGT
jgi:hypothetical protein